MPGIRSSIAYHWTRFLRRHCAVEWPPMAELNGATPPQGQGGDGVRTTMTATPGGSVTINVGPNEPSVNVENPVTGASTSLPVSPGKDTPIPIPNVPGGTVIHIRIGKGLRSRIILVEVIAPGP